MVIVIDTIWFTNDRGNIGIVIGEDDFTGKRKAYIGTASGLDEQADTRGIVDWGNKLSAETVKQIMHGLIPKKLHKK